MGTRRVIFFLLFTINFIISHAQISEGGIPYSIANKLSTQLIDSVDVKAPDSNLINQISNTKKEDYFIGILIDTNISHNNKGTFINHQDGSRSWFLKITSKNAIGLSLHFDSLYIPPNAELFFYNETKLSLLESLRQAEIKQSINSYSSHSG